MHSTSKVSTFLVLTATKVCVWVKTSLGLDLGLAQGAGNIII